MKYKYSRVIQQRYAKQYGWEDADTYSTNSTGVLKEYDESSFKKDLKEYKLMNYPTRVIRRREKL